MKEDTHFTTIGDEPVEARIVAWVLGEASGFEVAELERLCAERPELRVFRRRMLALHDLLTEAGSAQTDDQWKLPPDKRQALEELAVAPKPRMAVDLLVEKRVRHSARRAWLAIAACLVLTVVVAGLLATGAGSVKKAKRLSAVDREIDRSVSFMPRGGSSGVASEGRAMQSLTTTIPPELIEGTPKPVVLPNSPNAKSVDSDGTKELALNGTSSYSGSTTVSGGVFTEGTRETESLAKNEEAGSRRMKSSASSRALRVAAAASSPRNEIPESDDQFGKMSSLSSVSGGGAPGGLGGSGSGKGFGSGAGSGKSNAFAYQAQDSEVADASDLLRSQRQARPRVQPAKSDELPASAEEPAVAMSSKPASVTTTPAAAATPQPATEIAATAHEGKRDSDSLVGEELSGHTENNRQAQAAAKMPVLQGRNARLREEAVRADAPAGTTTRGNAPADVAQTKTTRVGADVPDEVPVIGKLFAGKDQLAKSKRRDSNEPDAPAGEGLTKTGSGTLTLGGAAREGEVFRSNPAIDYEQSRNKDHTRAQLLSQADQAWELSEDEKSKEKGDKAEFKGSIHYGSPIADAAAPHGDLAPQGAWASRPQFQEQPAKGTKLVQREMVRGQATVAESDKLLRDARNAYSKNDYQQAYEIYQKSLILLPDVPLTEERRDNLRKALGEAAVGLANQAVQDGLKDDAKEWLNKAREWDPSNPQARQQMMADFTSEIVAADEPYSTFSLNISDASFKVAQAAMAKGERPDPAAIKVEQFYNAVDYGDPAPTAGEPVAVSIEQAAHPVIPGRNLVRVALKTAADGRAASQPLRLTLLVDQSGSMVREDRRAAMDKALAGLAGLLTPNDRVTVIGFARTPHLLADGWTGAQAKKLPELVNQAAAEGGTNLEEAIKLAEQLAERRKLAGAQNRIVLFTDGAANLGDADPARLAARVKALRQKGLAFDIAGIAADGLNDELLGELARNGNGRYYVAGKGADEGIARQLAGAFRPAAENVKVQVHFNPGRVARYKLIGFEKDRLKTEDFRNDAVDAAELAAEEAGVAIYQVEPVAGGHGELGDVSVRFRDTASGQMVERTWTIPHEAATPALDRAKPSMQLAVLAMLAGEKLRGGPLAGAIDFKRLADPRANVKRFYGNSNRVAEVLRMIDAL